MTELDVDVVIEAARQFVSAHGHHIAGTLFPDDLARKLGTGMDMQADLELMARGGTPNHHAPLACAAHHCRVG